MNHDFLSHVKLKVLERSTGNKNVEEWNFLPKDWNYRLDFRGLRPTLFNKNFVLLKFHTWLSPDAGDILVLNLITRKSFWMWSTTLVTQMMEKAAGQVDFRGLVGTRSEATYMFVESDEVIIGYKIRMGGDFSEARLG